MKRPLALIAAPEAGLRAVVARLVRRISFGAELADTPRRALEILKRNKVDLAIIAPSQFGMDGRTLLQQLNGVPPHLAFLFGQRDNPREFARLAPHAYVATYDPLDELALLEWLAGVETNADGPTAMAPEHDLLELGGVEFDRAGRLLRPPEGKEIALSRAEFGALMAFVSSPLRVLSRDQLRRAVFGDQSEAYDRSIDMLLSRLRRKIEADPRKPRLIVTVPGSGYRMTVRPRKMTATVAAIPAVAPAPGLVTDAERRQLTILVAGFSDVAGLSRQLDPDDLATTVAQLGELSGNVVARWGGRLVSFTGHNLVAHFGYPTAHEDDPERAIGAGTELIETVLQMEISGSRLRVRVGIATGLVVVGRFGAGGTGPSVPTALGEASNIAARLEGAAAPGTLLIDNITRRRAGRAFVYQAFPPMRVEGVKQPVRTWRPRYNRRPVGRFAARLEGSHTRFVGRREEMALLEHRWRLACAGAGQVVVVLGEPGIGKSRLAAEFGNSLGSTRHKQLRCFASPHHTATPLFPILRQIERAAGLVASDGVAQKLEKMRRLLATLDLESEESLALLAQLLSISQPDEARLLHLAVQQRRQMTISLLQLLAERFGSGSPLLILWEDAQWLDSLTLELLASEVERAIRRKMLIVVTARPGFKPPWADYPYIRQLTLTRLDGIDAAELVDDLAGRAALPHGWRDDILERADGIPLFLEELTKEELRRPAQNSSLPDARKIPDTLHGLLLARIDGTGTAGKKAAQTGSAIGRSFSYDLLRLIEPDLEVDEALARLIQFELVFCRGEPPQANYVFRHALVQDAAYASLSRQRRRDLHARIAEALEQHFPDIVQSQPELLAQHHRQAGNSVAAIDYWLAGADGALLRSATAEAQKQLDESFKLLRTLPDNEPRQRRELTGQLIQHRISVIISGRTSDPAWQALRRALRLCKKLQDDQRLPPVIYGHWYAAWSSARFSEARRHAEALLEWAVRHTNPAAETHAEYGLGLCSQNGGLLEEAVQHLQRARTLDQFDTLPGAPLAGYWAAGVVRVAADLQLQFCLTVLGRIADAKALACAVPSAHGLASQPLARAIAQLCASRLHALLRDPQKVMETTAGLAEASYPDFSSHGKVYRGWALSMLGEPTEGLRLVREGIERAAAIGYRTWHSHTATLLAECEWRSGDLTKAQSVIELAKVEIAKTGERFLLADLYRLQAELHVVTHRIGVATRLFQKAIRIAQQQSARLLELRATTGLARLWAQAGRTSEAHALLIPIIDGFEGGPDFADLSAARSATQPLP